MPTHEMLSLPSDYLREFRTLAVLWEALRPAIGTILQTRLVIDTNMVISELLQLAKPRRAPNYRTALQELMASETIVCYAPEHLKFEIDQHWLEVAENNGLSPERAKALWDDYAAYLRFCPVRLESADLRGVPDPADLPFTLLAARIGAQIYSRDPHIAAMGGHVVTLDCVLRLRDYARYKTAEVTIQIGGVVVVWGTLGALILVFKALKAALSVFRRLPPGVKVLILLGLVWALADEGRRKVLIAGWQKIASGLTETLGSPIQEAFGELAKVKPLAADALRQVDHEIRRTKRRPLRILLRAALEGEASSLSLREIEMRVRAAGFCTTAKHFRVYLRKVLRQDLSFRQAADGTWRLAADTP
ncbi:MAG: PIN domain-containing protein [Gammaproteobacteria bacterium]|nr:PIN domain-containing protein [Gammaproteobacteria bacterium]